MSSSADSPEVVCRRLRPLLGTYVEIRACGPCADESAAAVERAFGAIAQVQRLMSAHDPASDVSRLNRAPVGARISVHAWTWRVLTTTEQLFRLSGGAFDVTQNTRGFLVDGAALQRVSHCRVRRRRAVRIDLGGIAKGFAIDMAIHVLQRAGVSNGCVNAGGDLRVFGPGEQRIDVRDPGCPNRFLTIARLRRGAVATSANYLDAPAQGRLRAPVGHPLYASGASITVMAPTALVADALTKVVAVLGPRESRPILDHFDAQAVLLRPSSRSRRTGDLSSTSEIDFESSHPMENCHAA